VRSARAFGALIGGLLVATPDLALAQAPDDVAPASAGEDTYEAPLPEPAPEESPPPHKKKTKKHKKHDQNAPLGADAKASTGNAGEEPGAPEATHAQELDGSLEKRFGKVEVFGRVGVRAELERHEQAVLNPDDELTTGRVDSFDIEIPIARLGVHYRAPVKWLSAQIEIDVSDGLELLDAWGMAKTDHFSARAGQFKVPFSAIEMESSFTLPMVRRGLVHDLLVDELEVAGRRPGVALGARMKDGLRASLVIGAFQGSVLTDEDIDDRDVELLHEQALDAQSFVARAEAGSKEVTFGLNYEERVGTDIVLEPRHYWTFGADATLDAAFGSNGLRVWAEGMAGASWFEHALKPIDTLDATFTMGRLVTAFRIGGAEREAFYVEPYQMFAVLDPDTDVTTDLVIDEALGVNVGLWKRARVGLELEIWKAEANFPARYFLGKNGDRKALVLGGQVAF
jgi:hypothetical protein